MQLSIETILNMAKEVKEPSTYSDYEFFKNLLHQSGHYGYEKQLAEILKI